MILFCMQPAVRQVTARADHEPRRRAAGAGRRRRHRVGFQIGPLSPDHRQAQRLKRWLLPDDTWSWPESLGERLHGGRRRKGVLKRHPHDRRRISSAVVIPREFFTGAVRPPLKAFPEVRRSARRARRWRRCIKVCSVSPSTCGRLRRPGVASDEFRTKVAGQGCADRVRISSAVDHLGPAPSRCCARQAPPFRHRFRRKSSGRRL